MAEKPAAEKTEQPTGRRIRKARREGQVPQSQEVGHVASIVVLVTMVAVLAPRLMQWLTIQMKQGMSGEIGIFANRGAFVGFINTKIVGSMLLLCPIFAALFAGSVMARFAVGGMNFTSKVIQPKFSMISPINGFQKLFNVKSAVHLLTSVLKLLFVSIIIWFYLRSRLEALAALRWAWSAQIIAAIAKIILGMMIRICVALLVIALADVTYQKWKYIQDLKMTRQEVKDEHKEVEGAPETKSRIRRVQYGIALKRMMQEVPKASVVLVNPTHVAVALRYEAKTMEAPLVVAKGADHLAEKIREIARAYGVPIVRRPELARTIYSTVDIGGPIPAALYVAVAEVLAMIYRLRHKKQVTS
jgi:flagellar biosynthetic protein FlhB